MVLYHVATFAIVIIGIGHAIHTFKKFKSGFFQLH
jgi:hypothetical protein